MKNISIYLLAIGIFLIGTSEMIVAGTVSMIAKDLHISIGLAGQLVTAFSLAFAIGTPILVTVTSTWERKKVLLGSLSIFLIGNLLSLLPLPFSILLIVRVVLGIGAGVFTVVAMSVSTQLVEPNKIGNAIGTVSVGFGLAQVIGVPLGVILGEWFGWKSIFAVLAVLSFFIMIPLTRMIPLLEGKKSLSIKQQLSILRNRQVSGGLVIFLFVVTGFGLSYTYFTPFLQETIDLSMPTISLCMLVFGVFTIVGTKAGGYGADKWGTSKIIFISVLIHLLFLILLPILTSSILLTLSFAALWVGISNVTIPALQTHFIQQEPQSSDLALSLSSSVAHFGVALGSGLGGFVINLFQTTSLNPWVSAGSVSLALVIGYMILPKPKKIITE